MKANLKGMDFKQLFIDHGEKLALGVVVVLVLVALFTTSWARYEKTPEDMATETEDAKNKINTAAWPESEQKLFNAKANVRDSVNKMLSPLDTSRFQYTNEIISPLYRQKEKIEEPEWQAVESLIAHFGRVVVEVPVSATAEIAAAAPQAPGNAAGKQAPAAEKTAPVDQSKVPEQFRRPTGRDEKAAGGGPAQQASGAIRLKPGGLRRRYEEREQLPDTDAATVRTARQSGGEGRGYRYVAVRGVFPLERQIQKLRQASHLPQRADLSNKIQFTNLQVQRQTAVNATDPWSGEWEDVDIELSARVLREAIDAELDEVDAGVIDPTIAMPLPALAWGVWGSKATHPAIENFRLTDEQMDQEIAIAQHLMAQEAANQAKQPKQEAVKRGGFYNMQPNLRDMRRELAGDAARAKKLADEVAQEMDPTGKNKNLRAEIEKQITPAGHLLLVRYLDFDVDPGRAYRYRVRLELLNPNANRLYEEVADGGVIDGATRWTPWSEPTEPVFIMPDTKYFVEDVVAGRGRALPTFDVFQWLPEAGTIVNEKFPVELGDFIGGQANTYVLDPAQELFEKEDVAFVTQDMLIDVMEPPKIDASEHPDLSLPTSARGRVDIPMQALVVDSNGDLKALDPVSLSQEHAQEKQMLDWERSEFQDELSALVQKEEESRLEKLEKKYSKKRDAGTDGGTEDGREGKRGRRARRDRQDR